MPLVVELPNAASALIENYLGGGYLIAGMPIALPGDTLPPYCLWADRSFVSFANWPQLKTTYEAGLLKVLPYTATSTQKTDNPFAWIEVEDESGLILPDIGNLFARPWRPGQNTRVAGSKEADAIRNITGSFVIGSIRSNGPSGAFYSPGTVNDDCSASGGASDSRISFDASRVVTTATENRPVNYAQPTAIFMGKSN
jgi:hypothetical protein